jgi:hypothetical protein
MNTRSEGCLLFLVIFMPVAFLWHWLGWPFNAKTAWAIIAWPYIILSLVFRRR